MGRRILSPCLSWFVWKLSERRKRTASDLSIAASPTWGKTSDIFGRKPIVLLANLTFLVGSLICALSIDIQMLLAGRVIQGVGGGGLLTMVYVCISDMFSLR